MLMDHRSQSQMKISEIVKYTSISEFSTKVESLLFLLKFDVCVRSNILIRLVKTRCLTSHKMFLFYRDCFLTYKGSICSKQHEEEKVYLLET